MEDTIDFALYVLAIPAIAFTGFCYDSLAVSFDITDYTGTVTTVYEGILPDLFAEGEGIVVAGVLDEAGVLHATEVLAKHDETYMPPEVAEALGENYQPGTGKGAGT